MELLDADPVEPLALGISGAEHEGEEHGDGVDRVRWDFQDFSSFTMLSWILLNLMIRDILYLIFKVNFLVLTTCVLFLTFVGCFYVFNSRTLTKHQL